ncbi:sterol desaturase family protein [Spirochaeta dissipatitropha]
MNIPTIITSIFTFAASFVAMEFVAMFTHKHIMHKYGWCLHYDHHNKSGHRFQKNDLYAIFFASLSAFLIYFGLSRGWAPMASSGFGVALYGLGYFTFHDIMYHGRIRRLKFKPKSRYLRRILNAHRVHHAAVSKQGALSFHFLWAPKKYSPENQQEVDAQLKEIREMQMMLKKQQAHTGS